MDGKSSLVSDYYNSGAFNCVDCDIHTGVIGEYYMVANELWDKHGVENGMLCIGCLEIRLQRTLTKSDFTECALNEVNNVHYRKSQRLLNRLTTRSHP